LRAASAETLPGVGLPEIDLVVGAGMPVCSAMETSLSDSASFAWSFREPQILAERKEHRDHWELPEHVIDQLFRAGRIAGF
jgi:hypothetical protein